MTVKQKEEVTQKIVRIKQIVETFLNEELPPRFSQFSKVGFAGTVDKEVSDLLKILEEIKTE